MPILSLVFAPELVLAMRRLPGTCGGNSWRWSGLEVRYRMPNASSPEAFAGCRSGCVEEHADHHGPGAQGNQQRPIRDEHGLWCATITPAI